MRFTIYGLWRNPHGSGYLEVKDVRENRDLVSRERTGVFYPTRALGVQVTHEKNVEEALKIAATIKANRLTPEDSQ